MSFHRVLPRPTALSDAVLARRWAIEPDSLQKAKIMTDERSATAFVENRKLPPPQSPQREAAVAEVHPSTSPGQESPEDHQSPRPSPTETVPGRRRRSISLKTVDTWQGESPSSICLCQPDPKVPRPRNAFILYRQHHQASVVSRNPGVANPEISKVIGDLWRQSSPEVKEHWKLLAEEEKLRHQKQYPDYRYQPRRSGRNSSVTNTTPSANSADSESRRCPKCGGKSISSSGMMSGASLSNPHNPSNPHSPSLGLSAPMNSSNARSSRGLISPPMPMGSAPQGYHYRGQTAHSAPVTLTSPRFKRPEPNDRHPRSPDPKRRRVTTMVYAPPRGPSGPQSPFSFQQSHQRRPSLPRPEFMGPSIPSPLKMGPPPVRIHPTHRPRPSLTSPSSQAAFREAPDLQAKSQEAMILSIPTLNKIRVLAKISAPFGSLPTTEPTSPASSTHVLSKRGIVIAIDAADPVALNQLTQTLAAALSEHAVRVFETPKLLEGETPSFESYLRLVNQYHALTPQIIAHITSSQSSSSLLPTPSPHKSRHSREEVHLEQQSEQQLQRRGEEEEDEDEESDPPISPKSLPKPKTKTQKKSMKRPTIPPPPPPPVRTNTPSLPASLSSTSPIHPHALPIALLPAYQLTHTNHFACAIPIHDRYSPVDHWQWHATVWRGVVGPDLTVAVQGTNTTPGGNVNMGPAGNSGGTSPVIASHADAGAGGTQGPVGGGETGRRGGSLAPGNGNPNPGPGASGSGAGGSSGGVEIRLEDFRAVVLRGEGGVGQGGLRRVGFEVGEWVRGWGGGWGDGIGESVGGSAGAEGESEG